MTTYDERYFEAEAKIKRLEARLAAAERVVEAARAFKSAHQAGKHNNDVWNAGCALCSSVDDLDALKEELGG